MPYLIIILVSMFIMFGGSSSHAAEFKLTSPEVTSTTQTIEYYVIDNIEVDVMNKVMNVFYSGRCPEKKVVNTDVIGFSGAEYLAIMGSLDIEDALYDKLKEKLSLVGTVQ